MGPTPTMSNTTTTSSPRSDPMSTSLADRKAVQQNSLLQAAQVPRLNMLPAESFTSAPTCTWYQQQQIPPQVYTPKYSKNHFLGMARKISRTPGDQAFLAAEGRHLLSRSLTSSKPNSPFRSRRNSITPEQLEEFRRAFQDVQDKDERTIAGMQQHLGALQDIKDKWKPKRIVRNLAAHVPPLDLPAIKKEFTETFNKDLSDGTNNAVTAVKNYTNLFMQMVGAIKPVCLATILADFYRSNDPIKWLQVFVQLTELYGIFWTTSAHTIRNLAVAIGSGFKILPYLCSEFKDWVTSFTSVDPTATAQDGMKFETGEEAKGNRSLEHMLDELPPEVKKLRHIFSKKPKGDETLEATEAEAVDWGWIVSIASVALSALVMIGGVTLSATTDWGALIAKTVALAGNAVRGATSLASGFEKVKDLTSTTLGGWFGVDMEKHTPKGKLVTRISELLSRIKTSNDSLSNNPSAALGDAQFIPKIEKMLDEVMTLYGDMSKNNTNLGNLRALVDELRTNFTELKKTYNELVVAVSGKVIPVCIYMFGDSGVGKSQFANKYLVPMLSALEGRELSCYSRCTGDKYWSSYVGQDVVIYDDFGSSLLCEDHLELVQIYTPSTLLLNMAELSEKGRHFSSKYLILCSNKPFIGSSATLSDPSILDRRRDLVIQVQSINRADAPDHDEYKDTGYYKANWSHLGFRRMHRRRRNGALIDFTSKDGIVAPPMSPAQIAQFMYDMKKERMSEYTFYQTTKLENFKKGVFVPLPELPPVLDGEFNSDPYGEVEVRRTQVLAPPQDRPNKGINRNRWRQEEPRRTGSNESFETMGMDQFDDDDSEQGAIGGYRTKRLDIPKDWGPVTHPWGAIPMGAAYPPAGGWPDSCTKAGLYDLRNETGRQAVKQPCFLFIGPPGTGKTRFAQFAVHAELMDEIGSSPMMLAAAVDKAWDCEAGRSDRAAILTGNYDDIMQTWSKLENNTAERWQAFMRRCAVYEFEFRKKGWFGNYCSADVRDCVHTRTPYSNMVKITFRDYGSPPTEVMDVFLEQLLRTLPREVDATIPDEQQYLDLVTVHNATHIVRCNDDPRALFRDSVNIMDTISKFALVRGEWSPLLALFYKCSRLCTAHAETIDIAMIAVNRMRIQHNVELRIVLQFISDGFLFDTTSGVLVVARLDEEENRALAEEVCNTPPKKLSVSQLDLECIIGKASPKVELVLTCMDVLLAIGKIGVGIYVIHTVVKGNGTDYKPAEKAENECTGVVKGPKQQIPDEIIENEGWAEDVEAEYPEEQAIADMEREYPPVQSLARGPVPKSARSTARQLEYCAVHHKMDTCYVNEARQHRSLFDIYQAETHGAGPSRTLQHETITAAATQTAKARLKYVQTKTTAVNETITAAATQTAKARLKYVQTKTTPVNEGFRNESMQDPAAREIAKICSANTLFYFENGRCMQRCLMLKGYLGVINYHAIVGKNSGDWIILRASVDGPEMRGRLCKSNKKRDLCFFELDKSGSQQFKDLTVHMITKADTADLTNHSALLSIVDRKGDTTTIIQRVVYLKALVDVEIEGVKRYGVQYQGSLDGYTYSAIGTTFGDCGSSIVVINTKLQRKILGIHSAANNTNGFGAMCYAEDIPSATDLAYSSVFEFQSGSGLVPDFSTNEIVVLGHQAIIRADPDLTYKLYEIFGYAGENGQVYKQDHPIKTKFYRSPLAWQELGELFEPAVLSITDPRTTEGARPYEDAMDKWSVEQPEIDEKLLAHCARELGESLAAEIDHMGYKTKVLTKTEAINGVSWLPGSNPIYRQTSAGYPMKHWEGVLKKSAFFEQDETTLLQVIKKDDLGRRLNTAVDVMIDCARKGKRSAIVFSGSLKDEPLALKKIYTATKTRSFAGSPIDYTIALRMYFHASVAGLASCFNTVPVKIGIDPRSTDWDILYHYHSSLSHYGWDCDFSAFDAKIPKAFMRALPLIYNRIYQLTDPFWKPADDVVRANLHSAVHGPLFMYFDTIVRAPGGQVSGQPLTAVDNSLVVILYYYYAWMNMAPRPMRTWDSFAENVRISAYGDDNMATVNPAILTWYNFNTLKAFLATIGQTVTTAAKEGEERPYVYLEELSFLKRRFHKVGRFYVGQLELKSLCKMLQFCTTHKPHEYWKEKDLIKFDRLTIGGTIDAALSEGALHGRDFYHAIKKHLMACNTAWSLGHTHWPTFSGQILEIVYKSPVFALSDPDTEYEYENSVLKPLSYFMENERTGDSSSNGYGARADVSGRDTDGGSFANQCASAGTSQSIGHRSEWSSKCFGPLFDGTMDTDRHTHLDNWTDFWDRVVHNADSSGYLQFHSAVYDGALQCMGRSNWIQVEDRGYGISWWWTDGCPCAAEHSRIELGNSRGFWCVRVRSVRSEGLGIYTAFIDGPEEHHVPLQAFGQGEPEQLRRVLCDSSPDTAGDVEHGSESDQCASVLETGTGIYCGSVRANQEDDDRQFDRHFRPVVGTEYPDVVTVRSLADHSIRNAGEYEHIQCLVRSKKAGRESSGHDFWCLQIHKLSSVRDEHDISAAEGEGLGDIQLGRSLSEWYRCHNNGTDFGKLLEHGFDWLARDGWRTVCIGDEHMERIERSIQPSGDNNKWSRLHRSGLHEQCPGCAGCDSGEPCRCYGFSVLLPEFGTCANQYCDSLRERERCGDQINADSEDDGSVESEISIVDSERCCTIRTGGYSDRSTCELCQAPLRRTLGVPACGGGPQLHREPLQACVRWADDYNQQLASCEETEAREELQDGSSNGSLQSLNERGDGCEDSQGCTDPDRDGGDAQTERKSDALAEAFNALGEAIIAAIVPVYRAIVAAPLEEPAARNMNTSMLTSLVFENTARVANGLVGGGHRNGGGAGNRAAEQLGGKGKGRGSHASIRPSAVIGNAVRDNQRNERIAGAHVAIGHASAKIEQAPNAHRTAQFANTHSHGPGNRFPAIGAGKARSGVTGSLWDETQEVRARPGGQSAQVRRASVASTDDVRQPFGKGTPSARSSATNGIPHVSNHITATTHFGASTTTSLGGIHGNSANPMDKAKTGGQGALGGPKQTADVGVGTNRVPIPRHFLGRSNSTSESLHQGRSNHMASHGTSTRFSTGARIADLGMRATTTALQSAIGFKNLELRSSTTKTVTDSKAKAQQAHQTNVATRQSMVASKMGQTPANPGVPAPNGGM